MRTRPDAVLATTGISLLLLAIVTTSQAGSPPADLAEARQESQITTTYALSPYLRASDLKVSVKGGKATLEGTVDDDVTKDLARRIALGVSGVTSVQDRINVKADYLPKPHTGSRSFGDIVEDASTTAAVQSRLLWSKGTDGMANGVDTKDHRVTLRGTAGSPAARALAGSLALNTQGVTGVDNQLVVDPGKAAPADAGKAAAGTAGEVISDNLITTRVNSTFAYSSNVDGSAIDVRTRDGIVTLSGTTDTGAERALAIELAGNIRGVKSVQSQKLTVL